jgi:transposase
MLEVEQWAAIRRLHRERFSIRKIAAKVGVSRNTVRAALREDRPPHYDRPTRPSCLDPYHDRIRELLAEDADLTAVRMQQILREDGYLGGLTILRDYLRTNRPQPVRAFQVTGYRPGEIGQVDWAQMPERILAPTGELRTVWALILTLGYSRLLDVVFSFGTKMADFLRAHARLLAFIGGVPKTLVYDNLSSVVTSHRGKEVTFNSDFLVFADHYGFRPHACTPGQPHEKGVVERSVGYIKGNFWPARCFTGLGDLQAQADTWRDSVANVRVHATLHERPCDRFTLEQPALLPLPREPWQVAEVRFARVTSQGLIHVDGNQYSVPALMARQEVCVQLDETTVVIVHHGATVACHQRCWGRHHQISDPAHLARPWAAPAMPSLRLTDGLQLPAKACVTVAVADLAHYDQLVTEGCDE